MRFMRSMIYLLIAVVFGLVTANLMYDVEQCDKTVQRYIAIRVGADYNRRFSIAFSKWFNWARVFSFCRYLNSTYDYGCKTLDCRQCLTVCLMDDEIRNMTSLCEQKCTTHACKEGCRFYSEVFINSSVVAHDTAIKEPKINNPYMISKGSVMSGVDLSWASVFSDDAFKIPSLYLVKMFVYAPRYIGVNKILTRTLTENSQHFIQGKDTCRYISKTNPVETDPTFGVLVIPINFVGPKSTLSYYKSYYTSFTPVESLSNVTVSQPFFEKSVEDNFDYIVWKVEWDGMLNITEGFQVRYHIYTCSVFTNMIEMRKLNQEKIYFVREESFRMRIRNSDDDKLDTCSIFLQLRTRHQCLLEKPYKTIIKYGGCKTIPGYPHPCRVITQRPPTVTLTYDVEQCDKTVLRYKVISCKDYKSKNKVVFSKWLNWARVFSFCRYLNSTYDYGCKTLDCRQCLTVCLMDDEIRNVTSLCERNCTTNACKEGCRFYSRVFVKSDVTHNTAIKEPKINNRYMISEGSVMSGIDLSWASVFSGDAFEIPSLYLVRMRTIPFKFCEENVYTFTLTETSRHLVQVKDMCRSFLPSFYHMFKFSFRVIPINFAGPKKIDNTYHYLTHEFRPVESPSKWSVSKPFFEKSIEDNFHYIVWKIEWNGSTKTTDGFRVEYKIHNCAVSYNREENRLDRVKKLNPEKVHLVKEGSFWMRILNTKDDELYTCSIFLELRTRHQCFFGKPYRTYIEYGGCKTSSGYSHPCGVITPRPTTVTLTYDVEQCDKTVRKNLAIYNSEYSTVFSKWLNWARVFSFCRYLNSTYDYGCKTLDCRQCLTVCLMNDEIRNVTSLCEQKCTTHACKEGCRFYSEVFINSSVVAHDTAIKKPKINNSYMISEGSVMSGVDLSWASVFSGNAFDIPSLYLVIMRADAIGYLEEDFYLFILTDTSKHLVQVKDMCSRSFLPTFPHQFHLAFSFDVTPVNFVGPKSYEDAQGHNLTHKFRPVELPTEWSVSKPFFEKSVKENFDYIVWEIELNRSSNIINGFQVKYNIYDCPESYNRDEKILDIVKELNPKKVNLVKEESFQMRIANTKDDKLYRCEISLELRIGYGECFYGNPHRRTIKYGGCNTIPGYPHPCNDTLIYEFSANISAVDCINPFVNTCPQSENITCQYCQTTRHSINVTWDHPTYVMNITEYTVRWGEMRKGIIDPKKAKTVKLKKSYTSFIFHITAYKTKDIGIQVHAETIMSRPRWKMNKNSIQEIKLKPAEPKPASPSLAPMQDKIVSPTTILVIVVSILAVSCSLALCITYRISRRNSNLRKKLKRNEIKQESDAVDKWEISYAILTIGKKIGEGAFGNVFCGFVRTIELRKTPYAEHCKGIKLKKKQVAVKFLKDDALETEYEDFYEEIKLMKDIGFHRNIVNMIGCGTITRPPFLVLEYMNGGDLLNYLRVFRKNKSCTGASLSKAAVDGTEDDSTENADHLSPRDVMSFSWQIACGMEYLSMNNVVHRDLAARNILISDNKKIKISDFGLSRFVGDELIYLSYNKSRKLPIKWMSIEAISNQEFTTASDIWAYGVVLFEIVTLGGTPYPTIGNCELCKILKSGYRMEKPENCDETVYNIMLNCWNELPTQRPTFTELRELLEDLAEKDETYFSFDIDENNSYYNVASFKSIPSDANDDGDDAFTLTNELLKLLNLTKTTTV